jgi:hypothetical protein
VLEMAIAIAASMLLIIGSIQIWGWLARNLVRRQEAYQRTRTQAGRRVQPGRLDYYQQSNLDIF